MSATLLYVFGLSAYWWVLLCGWVIYRGVRRFLRLSLYTPQERAALVKTEGKARYAAVSFGLCRGVVEQRGAGIFAHRRLGDSFAYDHGGVLGEMIAKGLNSVLGQIFTTLLLVVLFCAGLSWFLISRGCRCLARRYDAGIVGDETARLF